MYQASEAFHTAIQNGEPQKAMLIFPDAVFTNEDIDVDKGIEFHDYFNTEADIAIGLTPSNEISFSLFNDYGYLNEYKFGDFLATIGVRVGIDSYQKKGIVTVITNMATYVGSSTQPYLTRNNNAVSAQPSFPVQSIMAYDGNVWCFSNDGRFAVYNDSNGANITAQKTLNSFMKHKVTGWEGKGYFYNKDTRILFIYENGKRERYEFVPLGWFTAERPNTPDTILIDMTCYDYMQKFDKDMPKASAIGINEFPVTIGQLFVKMCSHVGVSYKTDTFINSTAKIKSWPKDFESLTMRDVLKCIAEAAGSNARFNRDGKLTMDWLRETTQTYTTRNYSDFAPYYYKTKKVTKLYNRSTHNEPERTYGTGNDGYLIQDNPLLQGVS